MKRKKLVRFLGVILFVAFLPGLTVAQTPEGALRGYAFSPVEDQATVSGANVTHDTTGYPFTPINLPFSDGFESGGLGSAWAVETDYEGWVRVDSTYPHTGSYGLLLGDDTGGGFTCHASAILALDLSGQSQVEMSFWWRQFNDKNDNDDGVFISDDYGATWYRAFSFNNGPSTFTQATIDLDAQAISAGMSLNDHFLVKFQFYDNRPIASDGYAIDEVCVQVPCLPDIGVSRASFEETALEGEIVTQTLTINNTGGCDLDFSIHEQEGTTTTALRLWKLTMPQGDADTLTEDKGGVVSPIAPEQRTAPMIALLADLTGVQILYDMARGERSTSSYDTMIGDLTARGAVVDENFTLPIDASILAGYDILWIDEWGTTSWTSDEQMAIQDWVNNGGLVMFNGDEPSSSSVIAALFGLNYAGVSGTAGSTTDILPHPVTAGINTVYVPDPLESLSPTSPAAAIVYDANNVPHIGVSQFGAGRALAFADDDIHDNNIGSDDNQQLGNQAFDWLAGFGDAFGILVYTDNDLMPTPNPYVEEALQAMGLSHTAYNDYAGFETALTTGGPWDLVIVSSEGHGMPSSTMDALYNYVATGGGRLIYGYWGAYVSYAAHSLFTYCGVSLVNDYTTPLPVYWWTSHPLLTDVPQFTTMTDHYHRDGQYMDAVPGTSTALAGYTTSPAANQGAIVIRHDRTTIVNGFTVDENHEDLDADSFYDGVELYMNEIGFLLGICNDPHEPNETPGQATSIGYGTTLSDPDICPAGDVDYYTFAGSAGDVIVADIDAQSIGSSLDSYLYLYDTDGVTELTHNDDYDGYDSHIEYVLPADGTYYLMVREYSHPSEGGPDYFYTISLQGFTPFDVDAGWTFGSPTVDGQIAAGEWDDAATYDITLPRARSQSQRDPAAEALPEALLQESEQQHISAMSRDTLSTVTLYAMNDGTHLYLAIDNPNDTIEDTYDQMGVYFDDNLLPSDGQWTNTSCGNPDGEGNFWVIIDTVTYREIVAGPTFCASVEPAPGTSGSVGYGSGHTQSEVAIDLTSSALRATPGDVINMYLFIYDASTGLVDGKWPIGADYQDPSTYRPLTLATCPVPAVPSLSSPADSSSTCDTTPYFDWSSVSGATSYRIQVDNDSNFSSPEINTTTSSSNYTPGSALSPGTYYWHVQASNSCGGGSWSYTWSATIMSTPAAPSLSSPSNGITISDTTPTFSWSSVGGATSYRIQVDDNSGFSSPEMDQTTSGTSYTPDSALPDGNTYYWRVQASNSCGSGPWSAVWEFAIQSPSEFEIYLPLVVRGWPPILPPPTLYPISNPDGDGSYTVSWSAASQATSYVLQEAKNSDFADAVEIYSGASTSHAVSGRGAARYYYRVKARNSWGDSGWSNVEWVDVLWEAEPNDDALTQANGPIVSGLTYYGAFPGSTDPKDYFYFDLSVAHTVELWLRNIQAGHNYDLTLRNANLDVVRHSGELGNADEHILTGVLPAGRYYIQVTNASQTGSTQPYHLRVVYE